VSGPRLESPRLDLIASTAALSHAELHDRAAFADLLSADVPGDWPPEFNSLETIRFNAQKLAEAPQEAGWWCWYAVDRQAPDGTRRLIGNGGFKGPPAGDRSVEVGYSFIVAAHGQGFATEFARALTAWAFSQSPVRRVIAETLPRLTASIRVLERCGFRFTGNGSEPGVIRYERRA
jgi:[ribosomal protein S5]-alanine N-acetyltransferase